MIVTGRGLTQTSDVPIFSMSAKDAFLPLLNMSDFEAAVAKLDDRLRLIGIALRNAIRAEWDDDAETYTLTLEKSDYEQLYTHLGEHLKRIF